MRDYSFLTFFNLNISNIYLSMQRQCKFGAKCWNKFHCRFLHPQTEQTTHKYCRFGQKCIYQSVCTFYHPTSQISQQLYDKNLQIRLKLLRIFQTKSEPDANQLKQRSFGETNESSRQLTVSAKTEKRIQKEDEKKSEQAKSNNNSKQVEKQEKVLENQSETSQLNALNQIHAGQQQYLQAILQQFLNVRLVKNNIFDEIFAIVQQNFSLEEVPTLFQFIQKLEQSQLGAQFTYLKIVKTIAKKGLNYQAVCEQLQKQEKIKVLKEQKYCKYVEQIPNIIEYEVLTDSQILQMHQSDNKSLKFIVDGDNVINSHKILRKYYKNTNKQIQIQGQIRLRWLLSEQENNILFFDYEKDKEQKYWLIANKIMYEEELDKIKLQPWHFANHYSDSQHYEKGGNNQAKGEQSQDENRGQKQQQSPIYEQKHQNNKRTADQLIFQWLATLQSPQSLGLEKVILISADRILIQKCLQEQPKLKISSGKFFIKYCKEHIRRTYYGNKNKKAVIKRIFIEPRPQA